MADPLDAITIDNANWAAKFQPTNLAQRQRYEEAKGRGEDLTNDQARIAQEEQLINNKGARDLLFKRIGANQAERKIGQTERRIGLDEFRAEQAANRDVFQQSIATTKAELDLAKEQRAQAKALMDSRNALRITQHSMAAEQGAQELIESGAVPGSEGFAKGAMSLIAKHPYMEKSVRDSLLSSAKIVHDPETFDAASADLTPDQLKRATWTRGSNGGWTVRVGAETQPKQTDELHNLRKELDSVVKSRAEMESDKEAGKLKPGFSEDDRLHYDSEKTRIRARIKELESGSTSGQAQESSSTAEIPTVADKAGFDALPSGATFLGQDGKQYRKP